MLLYKFWKVAKASSVFFLYITFANWRTQQSPSCISDGVSSANLWANRYVHTKTPVDLSSFY